MKRSVYCSDNVAYRQFVYNTLKTILWSIENIGELDSDSLKTGVEYLGFVGTFTKEDENIAATAGDIAEGKVAYVNGERIVGVGVLTEYELTITVGDNGAVKVNGDNYSAPVEFGAGAEIELEAIADGNYEFDKWVIDGTDSGEDAKFTYTMPKKAVTIAAHFKAESTG